MAARLRKAVAQVYPDEHGRAGNGARCGPGKDEPGGGNAVFLEHRRVLDPIERVSEVLFGLIMVLTFTGSLSVANPDRSEVREMLYGAIGCNLAWGIVDAVMYVLASVMIR